jgi:hypothetical protein
MKLLFCPVCGDVVKLTHQFRSCQCRACQGRYVSDDVVAVTGDCAEVIGLDSGGVHAALALVDSNDRRGPDIAAWMFQHGSDRIQRLGKLR